jgi:acetyl-CoA carboxylase carboxyltransferase component
MPKTNEEKFNELREMRETARLGGGPEAIISQHKKKKLTARERVELLLDPNTFNEIDVFVHAPAGIKGVSPELTDGVIGGWGKIDGRKVFIFAQDFTIMGGSLGERHAEKICKLLDMARRMGCPVIGINDSGGARIQEGVFSLKGYADVFYRCVMASGVVPQITAIMGPCAGGAVYSPALMDFVFMVKETSYMFLTGPGVIKEVLNEDVTFEELGGAMTHAQKSGVAHFAVNNEEEGLMGIRTLLRYLPQNNMEDPPFHPNDDDPRREDPVLKHIVPDEPNKPYDMKDIIIAVVDNGEFLEVQPFFAQNVIIGFATIGGRVIGIIANQPKVLAGCLDIHSSDKAARFIRTCDCFNIPIVTFQDVPGFLPGKAQEWGGIIRHGAKMLYAYCEATVPKLMVITRKSYGGAYCVMSSKHVGGDYNIAWPSAEVAVMGSRGAVNILYKKEIEKTKKPEDLRKKLVDDYEGQFSHPYIAASRGFLDEVIEPQETRWKLIQALEMFLNKREALPPKKHGNMPV